MEILEKSREREGMVKLGDGGVEFGSGLGFLRWFSLIKERNCSATWVSSGESAAGWGFTVVSATAPSTSCGGVDTEEE